MANNVDSLAVAEAAFRARGANVGRFRIPLPVGDREVLLVDGVPVAVHPKSSPRPWRHDDGSVEDRHGLREDLLRHYAAHNFAVVIHETDTGTLRVAAAAKILAATVSIAGTRGAFSGSERTCYFPASALAVVGA